MCSKLIFDSGLRKGFHSSEHNPCSAEVHFFQGSNRQEDPSLNLLRKVCACSVDTVDVRGATLLFSHESTLKAGSHPLFILWDRVSVAKGNMQISQRKSSPLKPTVFEQTRVRNRVISNQIKSLPYLSSE